MVRSVQAKVNGKQARVVPQRRKKSRSLLTNLAIGFGLTVAALTGASMVTMATAVKTTSGVKLDVAMPRPQIQASKIVTAAVALPRELDVSKFSRLPGSASAEPKGKRLSGAETAALEALRPEPADVRQMLNAAMVSAARDKGRDAAGEQHFAKLEKIRPDADAIRKILAPAMQDLVVVAPRSGNGEPLPDLIQDASTVANVAELKDMKPVEMAAVEDASVEDDDSANEEIAIAAAPVAPAYSLPQAGPLPVIRPSSATAVALAEKPAKPNALAAIAAVAPQQKPSRNSDDAGKPTALAFAKPDNPMRDVPQPSVPAPKWPGLGTKVAIYDITNGVVHMPNGNKLEAHSGIGNMRDNPKFTHVKMRGPTPPGTYKLSMRESLFHGVAAIRLTPVDGKAPQGRTGLLAHSFLLRVRGDSHGCVAFADYGAFLKAFQRGEITHMVIVPKWDGKRPGRSGGGDNFLVKLFGGNDA